MGAKTSGLTSSQLGSVADPRPSADLELHEGWNGYGWYRKYAPCVDNDNDSEPTCDNEVATATNPSYRKNAYIRHFLGGSFGETMVVYDALSGAIEAFLVRSGFLTDSQRGWRVRGGPNSDIGMPIEDERATSFGAEQCFQFGKLRWLTSDNKVYLFPYGVNLGNGRSVGPGVFAPDGYRTSYYWNRDISYRVAAAWKRQGGMAALGEPVSDNGASAGVHKWSGTRFLIQNFNGGSAGPSAIMYDLENGKYAGAGGVPDGSHGTQGWNHAYVIQKGFWQWYRFNKGISQLKAPISDEYPYIGASSRQDFLCGWLEWSSATGVIPHFDQQNSPGCLLGETVSPTSGICYAPKPPTSSEVLLDTGGGESYPAEFTISCSVGPTDMTVEITGPIQDGLFAPVTGSTVYLEYGSNADGWSPYTSGKPKLTWMGDWLTNDLPRTYQFILGTNVQGMNFFLYDPAAGHVEWFDLDLWTVTGDCYLEGTVIKHTTATPPPPPPATGTIDCSLTSSALTVTIDGSVQSLLVNGSVSGPSSIQYGSNTDGWSVPYSSGKPSVAWNGTNHHVLTLSPNIYGFNLYLNGSGGGKWFDLNDSDGDGDAWSVTGACWREGTLITHAAPPQPPPPPRTINCQVSGADMSVTISGDVASGVFGTPPTSSTTYLEYGSNSDGWSPYTSGKPKLTWYNTVQSYLMYLSASVNGMNFFLYNPSSGQTYWFDLSKWTVTGACYLDGTLIKH